MKNINIELNKEEFSRMKKVKDITGLSWKKFLFTLVEMSKMENRQIGEYQNYYNKGGAK